MPIYSWSLTANPGEEKEFEKEIEGNFVVKVRVRFPPGPMSLLKVAFFYGIKQLFPYEEGSWFQGDNEVIEWDEWWKMPENKIKIKVKLRNEDTTYPHTAYVTLVTRWEKETLPRILIDTFTSILRRILGWITI